MAVYRPEERRLVLRLMAFWDDLRGERDFPDQGDIDPEVLGDDWPHCYLLQVQHPPIASRFEHLGDIFRPGLPEREIETLADCPHGTLLHAATHYVDRVLQKRVPVSLGGHANLGPDSVLYRSILLPLSNDGHTIDYLFGGANFRSVASVEGTKPPANE
jgi:hypothetical protein